jgi:undecaprenyl-diphosphatase
MVFCAVHLIVVVGLIVAVCCGLLILTRAGRSLAYLLGTLLAAFLLLQLGGTWHPDHRPFMDHHVTQLVAHDPGASFPSDHTTAAAAAGFGLLLTRFRRTGGAVLAMALLIGFARVYVGVHYPLDILGGLVTALLGALVCVAARATLERRSSALVLRHE